MRLNNKMYCHYEMVRNFPESYIEDGSQKIGEGVYGKSITDPCLGWPKTRDLILELAGRVDY